jgi:FkbM family methyltransferase
MREELREGVAYVLRRVRFPRRSRVIDAVEAALGEKRGSSVVPLRHGGRVLADCPADKKLFYTGEHEWHVLDFLLRTAKANQTVFDVGANLGAYTIPLALKAGPGGRVCAFEASKVNYEILLSNIRLNRLTNVTPVYGAVAATTGTLEAPEAAERKHNLGNYSLADESPRRVMIPSLSLDDFALQHGIRSIDLLKVDVEGAEVLAMRGARRLFREGRVRTVCCEFAPERLSRMGSSAEELYELFQEYGMSQAFELTLLSRLRPIDKKFLQRASSQVDTVLYFHERRESDQPLIQNAEVKS